MPSLVAPHVAQDELAAPDAPAARPPQLVGGSLLQGHLKDLASDNLTLFSRCAEVGGLVRFRVYWYQCHVLTDPKLAGELLVTHAASFKKTRALQIARPTFGNGLVTSEGDEWRRQQRVLRPFLTPKAAARYAELITSCLEQQLASWGEAGVVDLHQEVVDLSLQIVCRALFGLEAGRLKPLIREAAHAVQQWHGDCQRQCLPYPHYFPSAANYRYRTRTRTLDRAVYQLIREVRARGDDEHGLLSAMLRVRNEDGSAISDEEIRDQLVTLFLAGHDTTAASLAFALYELSYRPELQARIAAESRADAPGETLEAVLKETLRLYPAVHLVARTALENVRLGPYLIKRGEEVVLPLYVLQRDPKLFADPHAFSPERWQGPAAACPRHAHLPFSAGPRVCTGQAMAMAELRAVVTGVVNRYSLEPLAERAPAIDARLTLAPAAGATRVRVSRH